MTQLGNTIWAYVYILVKLLGFQWESYEIDQSEWLANLWLNVSQEQSQCEKQPFSLM